MVISVGANIRQIAHQPLSHLVADLLCANGGWWLQWLNSRDISLVELTHFGALLSICKHRVTPCLQLAEERQINSHLSGNYPGGVFRVVGKAEMHSYPYYFAFQSHSLPGIQNSTEPPATICAQQISPHVARWLLCNLSIR
jgi:hypothetical protein